jgi:hypothetical protein
MAKAPEPKRQRLRPSGDPVIRYHREPGQTRQSGPRLVHRNSMLPGATPFRSHHSR